MKTTILLLLTLFTFTTSAQTDNADIQKTFEAYLKAVQESNYPKVIDYLYPKLFDIAPKEAMLQAMKEMSIDTTVSTKIHSPIIKKISKPFALDKVKYALIKYSFKMTMVFKNNHSDANIQNDGRLDVADFTYKILRGQYGEENVIFDREKSTIEISTNSEMYVINDPAYSGWKFLEKKEEMQPILEQILPKKVLKKF